MQKTKIISGLAILLLSSLFLSGVLGANISADEKGTEVLKRISSLESDSAEPSIASAPDGSIYFVWVEHQASGPSDVFLQKLDKDKNPVGDKLRVNPQIGKATAWRGDPPIIKVGADNTIYIGWTARVETDEGTANDLFLSVSHNGGQSFETPVKINDDSVPAVHGMHSLAIDKNNKVYFSWLDERNIKHENHNPAGNKPDVQKGMSNHHMEMNREVYFAVSNNGGKSFGANKRLASDACPCCKISMISGTDGRLYVSWRQVLPNNYRHIALTSSFDGGNSFTPITIVSDDQWQLDGCPVSGASLAVDSDNVLKVVWYSGSDTGKHGLYWSESKDNGKSFLPRELIYEGVLTGTPVLLANENKKFEIVWQSNSKVWQLSTELVPSVANKPEEVGVGKMPSATIADRKLFVGFIQNENDKRTIWLF